MSDVPGYAVFFFPQALEALGDAIKPYLQDGPAGPHIPCSEVDTAGAFIELTMQGETAEGRPVVVEVMVPANMVRMIVSVRSDTDFGFYNRNRPMLEPGMHRYSLPPATPTPAAEATPAVEPAAPDAADVEADEATATGSADSSEPATPEPATVEHATEAPKPGA